MTEPSSVRDTDRLLINPDPKNADRVILTPYGLRDTPQGPMRGVSSWALRTRYIEALPDCIDPHGQMEYSAAKGFALIEMLRKLPRGILSFPPGVLGETIVEELRGIESGYLRYKHRLDLKMPFAALLESGEYTEEKGWATLPPEAKLIESNPDPTKALKAYQVYCILSAIRGGGDNWWAVQGSGKTYTLIALVENAARLRYSTDPDAIRLMKGSGLLPENPEEKEPLKVLVIVPKALRRNWQLEVSRMGWSTPRIPMEISGEKTERELRLNVAIQTATRMQHNYVFVLCTYDSFVRDQSSYLRHKWDIIALDESQAIKNASAKRTKLLTKLGPIMSKMRLTLTGSPLGNAAEDLFPQIEFVAPGSSGCTSREAFKRTFNKVKVDSAKTKIDRLTSTDSTEFQQLVAMNACVLTKQAVLRYLPELTCSVLEASMTPTQRKAYIDLSVRLHAEITAGAKTGALTVNHTLTKLLRLAQITTGFMATDSESDPFTEAYSPGELIWFDDAFDANSKHDTKFKLLAESISDLDQNEKFIVWSCFTPAIDRLSEELEKLGYPNVRFRGGMSDRDRNDAVERFNGDKSVRGFIGNPRAGGAGLNLLGYPPGQGDSYDTNTTHMFFYASNFSYIDRIQAMARHHRTGTRVPAFVLDIVCADSIDDVILDAVSAKHEASTEAMIVANALKNLVSKT